MFPSQQFLERFSVDLQRDLAVFLPELLLCGTIVGLLLSRMFRETRRTHAAVLALIGVTAALVLTIGSWPDSSSWSGLVPESGNLRAFSGLVAFDLFGLYLRAFLLVFLLLALWMCLTTGVPDLEDSADFVVLLVGGTLGMMLMVSANHLLTAFIAVEMASLPSYALSGFMKGRRQGSEAALKYVIYGASASGIMLYGISLLAGTYGSGDLGTVAKAIASSPDGIPLPAAIGALCILVGLGFKLSAFPFHFWAPDVFHGASAEVGAFLSVASKAAALGLTTRFLFVLAPHGGNASTTMFTTVFALSWGVFAAFTATYGNLAALAQSNVKRLLAYSTIAHAGTMMLALVPLGPQSIGPLLFYVAAYLLMNLAVFAIVAYVRNATGSEEIGAFRGLIKRSPVLAVTMSIALLSLLGLPPLAGFAAKFQVFATLYDAGKAYRFSEGLFGWFFLALLVVAALNTAISAGYYLKLVRVMTLEEPEAEAGPIATTFPSRCLVCLLAGGVIVVGVLWAPLSRVAERSAHSFDKMPAWRSR